MTSVTEGLLTRIRSRVLGVVRRGPRTVLWTPTEVNLGNILYLWLAAHIGQSRAEQVLALETPASLPWLSLMPRAKRLLVTRAEVRLTDRRELGMRQAFGHDFTADQLEAFVSEIVVGSPLLDVPAHVVPGERDVVLNIRRGDYYSVEEHWRRYAFDLRQYVDAAVARIIELGGDVPRLHVVSDDIPWCRQHLSHLAADAGAVTFAGPEHTPALDFATLALARRLILTNSTFGYWAGYVGTVIHDHRSDVVAPWFHTRIGDHAADQLDPRWSVIDEIPGGWALPEHDPPS